MSRYVVPGVLALLAIVAGAAWWIATMPRDIRLESVDVARISDFTDLRRLPDQDRFAAKISFSAAEDFRKMMDDGKASPRAGASRYGYLVSAVQCGCDERQRRSRGDTCEIGFGFYDQAGEINHYDDLAAATSSRTNWSEIRTRYWTYVPLESGGGYFPSYDFVRAPADVCLRLMGSGYLMPPGRSNSIRVPRQLLSAAVARAHAR